MPDFKRLPVGIEDFRELTNGRYYFVDKTAFIREIVHNHDKVNLFTRPRRFGKTLNMNMLRTFFEIGGDKSVFDGLAVSGDKALCDACMGIFPVISVTLKGVEGLSFESALQSFKTVIAQEAERLLALMTGYAPLRKEIEESLSQITRKDVFGSYNMPNDVLERSFKDMSAALFAHYGTKPILFIDEYDVPLDKAAQNGYYAEMVDLIRKLFGNALKTNEALEFAVLTGCLRVSKESIFTGLNNFSVFTVSESAFSEFFGFTDAEVREMLHYYGFEEVYPLLKEWYDGYRFGDTEIYCPWDIVKYCSDLLRLRERTPGASQEPKNYWIITSGNAIIRKLIGQSDEQTKEAVENLIAGETLYKTINEALTYNEIYKDEASIWSLMLATGYLTYDACSEGIYALRIPNREIRSIFAEQVMQWFDEETGKEPDRIEALCSAVENGDAAGFEACFSDYLLDTISIRDTGVRRTRKENFYHGILLGLFGHRRNWIIKSNAEAGDGYSDLVIKNRRRSLGIIIELKYADTYGAMDAACEEALAQIRDRKYDEAFWDDRVNTVMKYGVAYCRKECKVIKSDV